MDRNRKTWGERQKKLRPMLEKDGDWAQGRDLFLGQHAMLHTGELTDCLLPSFADEIWDNAPAAILRRVPGNEEHSIAWCVWHMARIEDMTMSMLIAGQPQLVERENWFARMEIDVIHSGNAMTIEEVRALSDTINLDALWDYRRAVGRQTRTIVQTLEAAQLKQAPDPAQLQRMLDEKYVIEPGIVEYWSRRTFTGLLLMPPTRHNFIHLNEALHLKLRKS